jgi:hypothetical protein
MGMGLYHPNLGNIPLLKTLRFGVHGAARYFPKMKASGLSPITEI